MIWTRYVRHHKTIPNGKVNEKSYMISIVKLSKTFLTGTFLPLKWMDKDFFYLHASHNRNAFAMFVMKLKDGKLSTNTFYEQMSSFSGINIFVSKTVNIQK